MGLLNPHLDDGDFAEIWSARLTRGSAESDLPTEAHVKKCADCRMRYASFADWVARIGADGRADAEEAFTAERLAAQQVHIFKRLEALEHPARVIAFPGISRPVSAQHTNRHRWIAAAAAAGLVAGVALGQMLQFNGMQRIDPAETRQVASSTPIPDVSRMAIQPVNSQLGDELFLSEVELTSSQARVPESLRYLNEITPGARDYDPR